MNKMPSEIRLIVSRSKTEKWDFNEVMQIMEQEVDARERSFTSTQQTQQPPKNPPPHGTATALNIDSATIKCAFCDQDHQSHSCLQVTDVKARKEALRKSGRCYLCLRKDHLIRQCRSSPVCGKCSGKHHSSICTRLNQSNTEQRSTSNPQMPSQQQDSHPTRNTNAMYVNSQTPILLQTARLQLCDPKDSACPPACAEVRAIMDTGSQRTYVTSRVKHTLQLPISGIESLHIKTFGSSEGKDTMCETVELGLLLKNGDMMRIQALVVQVICNPLTSQPISHTNETYDHLVDLELANSANAEDYLEVDALIGSDVYWSLVTGEVRRGNYGPMAIHTKIGWVLSGPTSGLATSVNLSACTTTHTLMTTGTVCTTGLEQDLDEQLKKFWDLETLGIVDGESMVHEKFVQQISFSGQRYSVALPWKDGCDQLPDNLQLRHQRLDGLMKRLQQSPTLLERYDTVIREQLQRGIVELVNEEDSNRTTKRIHYLPHHAVVREDKATSKVRIVYDASARSTGPSLNDCLHTGPNFGQHIFDILLRFRIHSVALAGDIEKAFLMINVDERDLDVLRFLWIRSNSVQPPEIIALRFTRVVFGVNCSPFLLNATIRHHMETYV